MNVVVFCVLIILFKLTGLWMFLAYLVIKTLIVALCLAHDHEVYQIKQEVLKEFQEKQVKEVKKVHRETRGDILKEFDDKD